MTNENKINCNVIGDILPLYVDDVLSEDTKNLVEEHLAVCGECCEKAEKMERQLDVPVSKSAALSQSKAIQNAKKRFLGKKIIIAVCSVLITAIIGTIITYALKEPFIPIEYSPQTILTELEKGNIEVENPYGDDLPMIIVSEIVKIHCTKSYKFTSRLPLQDVMLDGKQQNIYCICFYNSLWSMYVQPHFNKDRIDTITAPEQTYITAVPDYWDKIVYIDSQYLPNDMDDDKISEAIKEHGTVIWSR